MAQGDFMLPYITIILLLLLYSIFQTSRAKTKTENGLKIDIFLSPRFTLEPGLVSKKYYYGIDFPLGHIAVKSFNAEIVDENGNPIPLNETYLHHWVVYRYYQRKGVIDISNHQHSDSDGFLKSDRISVRNSGVCGEKLDQYFGIGAETRRTKTSVPDPYGIEVGNPRDVPDGYEEIWMLNVHAIDTRGAEDKSGCTECRCDLYNVTSDEYGHVVPETYKGGLRCCHDGARCKVRDGFKGSKNNLYLRYTVKYVDWNVSIVPVKIYIFDATDKWTKTNESRGVISGHHCLVEYNVDSCPVGVANDSCIHTKTSTASLPIDGYLIYGVGHQHVAGIGTALYGEGGREICSSNPIYGTGVEPGNESDYVVGMSTCYPIPGSIKISGGETLTFVTRYNNTKGHVGVMGFFYVLVADSSPNNALHDPNKGHRSVTISIFSWALFGVTFVALVIFTRNIRVEKKAMKL